MLEDLGLGFGGLLRSVTHCGGGRESEDVFEAIVSRTCDKIERWFTSDAQVRSKWR